MSVVNLIGISGKIGSGKDTIGKIIQYLVLINSDSSESNLTWESFNLRLSNGGGGIHLLPNEVKPFNWRIKKYAFKLKQIASLMLGIPVEDFEKQEVKDRVLGEEWWYFYYEVGGKKMYSYLEYKDNSEYNTFLKKPPTVREFLQLLGTEAMRNVIHPNAWVNALFADYKGEVVGYDGSKGKDILSGNLPNWIITDVRFPNERKAIEEKSGIVVRVQRSKPFNWTKKVDSLHYMEGKTTLCGRPMLGNNYINHYKELDKEYGNDRLPCYECLEKINANQHPSETALDNQEWDYLINNDGTIEELIEEVRQLLKTLEIL